MSLRNRWWITMSRLYKIRSRRFYDAHDVSASHITQIIKIQVFSLNEAYVLQKYSPINHELSISGTCQVDPT